MTKKKSPQQLSHGINRGQVPQQAGTSSATPIVITSTNNQITNSPITMATQPSSLFIVVSLLLVKKTHRR